MHLSRFTMIQLMKESSEDLQMFLMGVGMDQQIIDVDKYGEIT